MALISRVEALNFRCLRHVNQDLSRFHVLVGPNASGKTTFLDVVAFLSDLVRADLDKALSVRTDDWKDLLWRRDGTFFELAVEANIPAAQQGQITLKGQNFDTVRYEVRIGETPDGSVSIQRERGTVFASPPSKPLQPRLEFPLPLEPVETLWRKHPKARTVLNKTENGTDKYYSEVTSRPGQSGWFPSIKLGPRRSTLGSLPFEEERFPAMTWFRQLLLDGVQTLALNSLKMRGASPPGQGPQFLPDGSNLPWVVEVLKNSEPGRFADWLAHLNTALPDLRDVRVITKDEDRHKYLMLCYDNGIEVPSWTASDGTLRLLALTLPAYLSELSGVYLIEEPENGIHPRAVETMFDSLCSVYGAQILLASHSPVVLNLAAPRDVLCFAKTGEGATDIVRGDRHPALSHWRGEVSLGTLFGAGVLS